MVRTVFVQIAPVFLLKMPVLFKNWQIFGDNSSHKASVCLRVGGLKRYLDKDRSNHAFLVQGLPLVPIQKLLICLPNSSIALWMCTKSQKDGQNHENTGIKRAIFHKCKMHFYRRFSHTGSTSHPFLNLKYRKWGPKISIWSPWFRTHNRAQNKYSYFDLRQAVNAKQVTKLWTL